MLQKSSRSKTMKEKLNIKSLGTVDHSDLEILCSRITLKDKWLNSLA